MQQQSETQSVSNLSASTTGGRYNYADSVLGSSSLISPSNAYLAISSGSRLTIRDVKTSEVLHIFSCIDRVEKAEFSPDSQFILCAMFSRNAVQIFSMIDGGEFVCVCLCCAPPVIPSVRRGILTTPRSSNPPRVALPNQRGSGRHGQRLLGAQLPRHHHRV